MIGSVAGYVTQVDGALGAAEGLFAGSAGAPAGVDGVGPAVPQAPGAGRLGGAVGEAGWDYRQAWEGAGGLSARSDDTAGSGRVWARQGRAAAGTVRGGARSVAAALAPATGSAAGVRLLVNRLDERLAAMQRQINDTQAYNRLLALRLRELAAAYRVATVVSTVGRGVPVGGAATTVSGLVGGLSHALPAGRRWGGDAGAGVAGPRAGHPEVVDAAAVGQGRIPLSQVAFAGRGVWPGGRSAIGGYLEQALTRMGITDARAREQWRAGMMTIAEHESSFRAEAINLSDSNAHGPPQVDGGPLHATRGPWQVMPDTFASYHEPGTSNSVWDPVASACASMNYQMSRYGVSRDGANLRALVGQANPGVHQGY